MLYEHITSLSRWALVPVCCHGATLYTNSGYIYFKSYVRRDASHLRIRDASCLLLTPFTRNLAICQRRGCQSLLSARDGTFFMSRIVTSMRVNRRDTSRIMYNFKTYLWRCPRRGCQSVLSVRDGSFFSGSHLKLNEVVELFYWWTRGHTIFNVFHERSFQ